MTDDLINRATVYSGETLLLRWNESAKGRSVTLQLDPNLGEQHPFKNLKCGENGSRVMLVAVLIGDDETPQPHAVPAQRSAPKDLPVKHGKPFRTMPLSQQCGLMCSDPKFIEWLGCETEAEATHTVKEYLGITSRKELLTNSTAAHRWSGIHASYEYGEAFQCS